MKKLKEYMGIITIYKNVYIEAENEKEAGKILEQEKQDEQARLEDIYNISDITLTK